MTTTTDRKLTDEGEYSGCMTDKEVSETVAALRLSGADRAALLRAALAGDQGARFAVYFSRLPRAGRRVTIRQEG